MNLMRGFFLSALILGMMSMPNSSFGAKKSEEKSEKKLPKSSVLTTAPTKDLSNGSFSLTDILQEALDKNPKLRSIKHKALSIESLISPAGAYPDPMLSFEMSNFPIDTFSGSETPMTGKEIRFVQKIPFPGKLTKIKRAATHRYRATKQEFEEEQLNVIFLVKKTYYALYLNWKTQQITFENERVLEQFVENTNTKYTVGKGLQQDVLKAQVELSVIRKTLIHIRKQRKFIESKLNILLNRNANTKVGHPRPFTKTKVNFKALSVEEMMKMAHSARPKLKKAHELTKMSENLQDHASWGYAPDFEFGVKYRFREPNRIDDGTNFASAFIGIKLPLYFLSRQIPEHRAATEALISQRAQETHIQKQVGEEIQNAFFNAFENQRLTELYEKNLLPEAEQALKSAEIGYQVDKVDFLTLLNNEKALFSHKIGYEISLFEYETAVAALESKTGKLVSLWSDIKQKTTQPAPGKPDKTPSKPVKTSNKKEEAE